MIRVNLLRNRVGDAGLSPTGPSTAVETIEKREAIVKVVLMLLFTAALIAYESHVISGLNVQVARSQSEVAELRVQAQAKQQEADAVKDVEKDARELEDKLKVLKLLSRLRLREVKTLDYMQSSIPEKVWLKVVDYDSEDVKSNAGRLAFRGNSAATEDLTEFVRRLEESTYLDEVIVIKNQEVKVPGRSGTMRDFEFTAQVEAAQ